MVILKWYSISIIILVLLSIIFSGNSKTSTVMIGGFMFIPILAYLVMG